MLLQMQVSIGSILAVAVDRLVHQQLDVFLNHSKQTSVIVKSAVLNGIARENGHIVLYGCMQDQPKLISITVPISSEHGSGYDEFD